MQAVKHQFDDLIDLSERYGLSIFPVNKDKAPIISTWTPYQYEAPSLELKRQWQKTAKGFALVTGEVNGIMVLDIDVSVDSKGNLSNGYKSIKPFNIPETAMASTTNGGKHVYFKMPERPGTSEPFHNFRNILDGVDIRAEGGYVVMPNSEGYEWIEGYEFNGVDDLAEAPQWLIEMLENGEQAKAPEPNKMEQQKQVQESQGTTSSTSEGNTITTGKTISDHFKDAQTIQTILKHLGINTGIGKHFKCIMPTNKPDTKPSASIAIDSKGRYSYVDWREELETEQQRIKFYTLPEVYASLHYKRKIKLRHAEHATWALKLLCDSGILQTEQITARPLHDDLNKKPAVKKVYEGFIYLLEVKKLYSAEQEATAFSFRFASAWCNVSHPSVSTAFKQLLAWGYIEKGEQAGQGTNKMNTYYLIDGFNS